MHVIGVLVFMTYGAIKDSAKYAIAKRPSEENKFSRVARMIGEQPQLLSTEVAAPGEKLIAVREPDPFRTGKKTDDRPEANLTTAARPDLRAEKAPTARSEEPLPPVVAVSKKEAVAPPQVRSPERAHEDAIKDAFLAATGRVATAVREEPAPQPEVRKAASVSAPLETTANQSKGPVLAEYIVQPGDNIFTISRRMNVSFSELAAANNLSSPRDVHVGQVLVSPSAGRSAM